MVRFVISQIQPEKMRISFLSKKSSTTAVSSWGFSGYITVLPKDNADKQSKKEKPTEKAESQKPESKTC